MLQIRPITSSLLLALYGTGALAQGLVLEEVIVTAQKRSESLQDVPVPQGYNPMAQLLSNILLKQRDDILVFLLTLLLLLPFYVAHRMKRANNL